MVILSLLILNRGNVLKPDIVKDKKQLGLVPQTGNEEKETTKNLCTVFQRPGLIWAVLAGVTNSAYAILLGSVAHVTTPMQSLFISSAFLLVLVVFISWKESESYDWRDLGLYILCGFLHSVGTGAGTIAFVLTSTADASAILYNKAIPASLIACIFVGERLDIVDGALLFVNGVGLVLVCKTSVDKSTSDDGSSVLGMFLACFGVSCFSFLYNFVRLLAMRKTADPPLIAFMFGFNGVVISSIYLSITGSWIFPKCDQITLYICLGSVTIFEFYSFTQALAAENAYIVAASITLSVPLTYCYEVIFTNRVIVWQTILGVVFSIGSTVILQAKSYFHDQTDVRY
ncbi:hypothetical protein HOLleu_39453 [Holothuria leucospilota]|uniref:EamA domain-containing protein n=1 Tax=Holothuria leucospilota TaxID=206669 RepID=A0A9Q0YNC5_HOLLE|nr:hypothetical protein HOLleu_39453 [Holothuria leucospilota]